MRQWMVRLHRYVGLILTGFLVIVGLTGCVIAYFSDLDPAINPDLLRVTPGAHAISALELRERVQAQDPRSHVYYIHFPEHPDHSFSAYVEGAIDRANGRPFDIGYDEVFANPYTGERLGQRMWGNFSLERHDLVTQLYFLHYSLVLPEALGEGFMGIVALVWAFDCFVGLYLTFPSSRSRGGPENGTARGNGFWRRWLQTWRIKRNAGKNRLVYDVHRAVSLWVWAMLFVFAVSGFALNMPRTYSSVMSRITHYEDVEVRPELATPLVNPAISWSQALSLGERYMSEQAHAEGFTINRPTALIYRRELGVYFYRVHSSRDVVNYGATSVGIDATTGQLTGVEIPTGQRAGNTFSSWIIALHTATAFGLPWRIFVSFMGLVVVTLSVTGVLIWWRKRGGARARRVGPEGA